MSNSSAPPRRRHFRRSRRPRRAIPAGRRGRSAYQPRHIGRRDPIFVGEGDIDAACEIVAKVADAELFLYPGDQHYFADSSLPSYDPEATALLRKRVLEFLARV